MLSILKAIWMSYDEEKRKRECKTKFEEEQRTLDERIERENSDAKVAPPSAMQNVLTKVDGNRTSGDTAATKCFMRLGVITKLSGNHGCIDHSIFFEMSVAMAVANELKVGCQVEYLAYQPDHGEYTQVVKIEQVVDTSWDCDVPSEEKLDKQVAALRLEQPAPKYFDTHQRNVLGIITERTRNAILIETDYKLMSVNLDNIELDFVPQEGDRVFACCDVQLDEHFADRQGEILKVVSVHAARTLKQQQCTVSRMHGDWAVLNEDIYLTFDMMPATCPKNVSVGDVLIADLIECERGDFNWRCVYFKCTSESVPAVNVNSDVTVARNKRNRPDREINHALVVSEDVTLIFTNTFETQKATLTLTNNADRPMTVFEIRMGSRQQNATVKLIDPPPTNTKFELAIGEKRELHFEATPIYFGEARETVLVDMHSFRVKRSFALLVYDNEADAQAARERVASGRLYSTKCRASNTPNAQSIAAHRSRLYANQVWSKKAEVIPGVSLRTRRRFVAVTIEYFEVPERLRNAYLTAERRKQMHTDLDALFPCLGEELNAANYTERFRALLHLEEIECFVNFRRYDRERAHFTREGEFLSLHIENLAEKRPSLVMGDTVRAINPWCEDETTTSTPRYDGLIHKVLHDRVLLKFNAGFQSKYNGEDYRLEFHFSRFSFRKQHHSIGRMTRSPAIMERLLFPARVHLREKPQLAVTLEKAMLPSSPSLDSNGNGVVGGGATGDVYTLQLNGAPTRWFNHHLNEVQQRAICHILRGETELLPYVIFGPPGTGKTITLVEIILQLMHLVPGSRILVATPSNSAADLMAQRLIDTAALQPGDFVRLVSHNSVERETIPEELLPYCATPDFGKDGTCGDTMVVTDSGLKLRCSMKSLGRHRISIGTCATLGNFIPMAFPPGHFTHVVIDECGQCAETEAMVPISLLLNTTKPSGDKLCAAAERQEHTAQLARCQVILAGDPQQLSAIVTSRIAAERGLALSYLDRIVERVPYRKDTLRFPDTSGYDPRLITKLLYNYRALPSIMHMYNDLFYDRELRACVDARGSREARNLEQLHSMLPKSATRSKSHGVFFYGMLSENKQEPDSPSWYNPLEARNVYLMTIELYRRNVRTDQIGIITPYNRQVKHLRTLFIAADIAMPKIGTVEEFQGQERDVILISTVRSTEQLLASDARYALGFVQSAKRMNVAISRCRFLMFIFGNPHLLALDRCWRAYIQYCVDNDAYLGCDLPAAFTKPVQEKDTAKTATSTAEAQLVDCS